jgi:RHS repeat-associated protein
MFPLAYLFTGRELDILDYGSLKIQYNRNRYYDSYTGRWTTQDPLGITPNQWKANRFAPVDQYEYGLNLYEYVGSNPVLYGDPLGLYLQCFGTCRDTLRKNLGPAADGHPGLMNACRDCCMDDMEGSESTPEEIRHGQVCAVKALMSLHKVLPPKYVPDPREVIREIGKGAREEIVKKGLAPPACEAADEGETRRHLACDACGSCLVGGYIGCSVWCTFGPSPGDSACLGRCMRRVSEGIGLMGTAEAGDKPSDIGDIVGGIVVGGCKAACTVCGGSKY